MKVVLFGKEMDLNRADVAHAFVTAYHGDEDEARAEGLGREFQYACLVLHRHEYDATH